MTRGTTPSADSINFADRIDQIVVPLVANMARKFGTSPVPDLFTMTPGFWGLLRQAQEDDRNRQALLDSGVSEEEANRRYDVWRSMTKEQREWNQERTLAIIRHMAKKWPLEDGSHEVYRRPKLIWRALHQIKAHRDVRSALLALDPSWTLLTVQLTRSLSTVFNRSTKSAAL